MSNEHLSPRPEIFQEGYIENLVKEERFPRFIDIASFGDNGERKEEVMVVVPSVKLTGGNRWEVFDGGAFEVVDSEGKLVGRSKYHWISPEEANSLKSKINELQPQQENKGIKARLSKIIKHSK